MRGWTWGLLGLVPAVLSGCAGAGAAGAAGGPPGGRLNVLHIIADDLRCDLGSLGGPALTPHLDALARRGVSFRAAYCQQALCNPSRSSFLTGRRPDSLQLWHNGLHFRRPNPGIVTLPEHFRLAGWETRGVGKIFHNWHTTPKGDRQSWSADEFLHYANHGDDTAILPGVTADKLPPNSCLPYARPYGTSAAPLCECRDVPDEAYYDGRVAAEAVRTLGEIKDRPFLLAVGFWKPHAPFNAPKKYWDLYRRDRLPVFRADRPEGAPDVAFHDGRELRGVPPNSMDFTPGQVAEIRHGYLAAISYMDAQVGRVLAELDRLGLRDRTVVVFHSDHGYHVGENGLWAKTSNFERDARVPLIIAPPGCREAGKSAAGPVELLDLFPTVCDLAGLRPPTGLEGASLVPVLADVRKSVKPAAFTQHPRPAYFDRTPKGAPDVMGCSVRTGRVRLTEWRDWETGRLVGEELYDPVADSDARRNLMADAAAEPADGRLRTALDEARRLLHARFPPDLPPAKRR